MTTSDSTGVLLPDEAALRGVFDAEYSALIAKARSDLKEAEASAPRVVESAFVHAWHERAHITSREQLMAMLQDDVHHGAVRALSRRAAAHRFGEVRHTGAHAAAHAHHEVHADAEQSWQRILGAIHGANAAASHTAAALAAKHETATHVAQIAKPRSWKVPLLVGAAAILGALGLVWALDRMGVEQAAARAVNAPNAHQLSADIGQRADVTLDDGTKARLAAESKLAVPETFGEKLRAVKLDGAASFQLAPEGSSDFQVFARRAIVSSRGATFAVRAYEEDESALVQVREGTATVRSGETSRELAAGSAVIVGDDGVLRDATPVEVAEATAWLDGRVQMENRPLRRVLPEMRRWYADIKVIDPDLFERLVTVRAPLEATRDAIAQVERTGKLRFERTQDNMVFRDSADVAQAGAPAARKP